MRSLMMTNVLENNPLRVGKKSQKTQSQNGYLLQTNKKGQGRIRKLWKRNGFNVQIDFRLFRFGLGTITKQCIPRIISISPMGTFSKEIEILDTFLYIS